MHQDMQQICFNALGEENVEIEMITTSEIRITCLVKEEDVEKSVKSLHSKFELDKD